MAFGLQFPGAEFCVRGAIIKEGEFSAIQGRRTGRSRGTTDEAYAKSSNLILANCADLPCWVTVLIGGNMQCTENIETCLVYACNLERLC